MNIYRKVIIATLVLFCIFGALGIRFVLAQELTEEITAGGDGSFVAPLRINAGTRFNITFDKISITGRFSIEEIGFTGSFSSSSGAILAGPYQVTLEPGEYTFTEVYQGDATSSNKLLNEPILEISQVTFTRIISVPKRAIYTISVNTTIRDLETFVRGPFEGEKSVPGVIGDTFTITLVNTRVFQQSDLIEYSAGFTATAASNTIIEIQAMLTLADADGNVLEGEPIALEIAEGESISIRASAIDADSTQTVYSVNPLPEGAIFDSASGLLEWTPNFLTASADKPRVIVPIQFQVTVGPLSETQFVEISVKHVSIADKMQMQIAPDTITANGASQAEVTITVTGEAGVPVPDELISLTADSGSISERATHQRDGVYTATYIAGLELGEDTITAAIALTSGEVITQSETVTLKTGPPALIGLSADKTDVSPDGRSAVGLTK